MTQTLEVLVKYVYDLQTNIYKITRIFADDTRGAGAAAGC